jgi:hypothetical protein
MTILGMNPSIRVVSGIGGDNLQGWISHEAGQVEPSQCIIISQRSSEWDTEIAFAFRDNP